MWLKDVLARLGILAHPVNAPNDEILGMPRLRYGVRTADHPVDTHALLTRVALEARLRGGQFVTVSSLENVQVSTSPADQWLVTTDQLTFEANFLVLACGAYIPEILKRIAPGTETRLRITKIPVMVVQTPVAKAMFLSPLIPAGPNVVPFRRGDNVGATVCLVGVDRDAESFSDFEVSEAERLAYVFETAALMPGFHKLVQNAERGVPVNFYACQKVGLVGVPTRRHLIIDHSAKEWGGRHNLMTFYPGKFTSAPLGAKECALAIAASLRRDGLPKIASQPYFDAPRGTLTVEEGRIRLDPLPEG